MWGTLLGVCGLLVAAKAVQLWLRSSHLINNYPRRTVLPLIGDVLFWKEGVHELPEWKDEVIPQYGEKGIFVRVIGTINLIQYIRPEYIKEIVTNSNGPAHDGKSQFYEFLHKWLGQGLLTSNGELWHQRRKLLTPAFHFGILNGFEPVYQKHVGSFLANLAKSSDYVDIYPLCGHLALDVVCEAAMGTDIKAQESDNPYVAEIFEYNTLVVKRMLNPAMWNDLIYYNLAPSGRRAAALLKNIKTFTSTVVQQRKEARRSGSAPTEKRALLDLLLDLQDEGKVDEEGLLNEVDTFMFEGHDTTAAGLAWALYALGQHDEVQARLYDEVHAVMGDATVPTKKDVERMPYLAQVLKECHRLHPPVPSVSRVASRDCEIGGLPVKTGDTLAISIWGLHHNSFVWKDPEKFDPERFGRDRTAETAMEHLPFSAGARNCVGQKFAILEEKMTLAAAINSYRWSTDPLHNPLPVAVLILKPSAGIRIKFEKR